MADSSRSPHRQALGLALAQWASALSLPVGLLLGYGWLQGQTPLVAEASRWIYAPTSGLMILLAAAGWVMAGAKMRKKRPRKTQAARVSLCLSLSVFVGLACTAMQAKVLLVSFHNESTETLDHLKVKIFEHEVEFQSVEADQTQQWMVIDEVDSPLKLEVFVSQGSSINKTTQSLSGERSRELRLRCTPELDLVVEQ